MELKPRLLGWILSKILGGIIAGIAAGIVAILVAISLMPVGIIGVTGPFTAVEQFPFDVASLIIGGIGVMIISGIIFGIIYSELYKFIPGEGMSKGISYGLLIWIVEDVMMAMFVVMPFGAYYLASSIVVLGLPLWLVYGVVLEFMHERIKLAEPEKKEPEKPALEREEPEKKEEPKFEDFLARKKPTAGGAQE